LDWAACKMHEMAIMTSRALRAVCAAVIVAVTITACQDTSSDPAACKAALQAQYVKAKPGHDQLGPEPANCKGLPKAEVQRFTQQVLQGK